MNSAAVLAASTWKSAMRSPAPWALALLGAFAVWAGATLDVLAIEDLGDGSSLGWSTAEGVSILVCLVVVARTLAEDRSTGLDAALSAGRLGVSGRLSGRMIGGVLAALTTAGFPVICSIAITNDVPGSNGMYLSYTSISMLVSIAAELLLVAAWTVLLSHVLPPAASVVSVLVLVVAGRALRWGWVLPLLPRPLGGAGDPARPSVWAVEALAAGGLLLLAAARAGGAAQEA